MITASSGSYSDWAHKTLAALAQVAMDASRQDLIALLGAFGPATEPDFSSIAPIYNKVLAVALLITAAVIAYGICERILGGSQGIGLEAVPRTVACVISAFCGLGVIQYVGGYASLIATIWAPDLSSTAQKLSVDLNSGAANSLAGHPWSVLGLFVLALFLTFLIILVFLELVVRSALILVVTAFVPMVACMAVWPRLAGGAMQLGGFLAGLFFSKFVVATTLYVGLHLVFSPVVEHGASGMDNWMATGVAVLLIAAFSPLVVFKAVSFSHSAAGDVTRDLGAGAMSMVPVVSIARGALGAARKGAGRATSALRSRRSRINA